MDWETFHNSFIEATSPVCHSCGDDCYRGEGFVARINNKPVVFCSHCCLEDWESDGNETDEWGCWTHKATNELLEETIKLYKE